MKRLRTVHRPTKKHGKDKYDRKADWLKDIDPQEWLDMVRGRGVILKKLEPPFLESNIDNSRAWCGECGKELEFVRPGKWQCNNADCPSNARNIEDFKHRPCSE